MSVSPYKKFKAANKQWIGYLNISKLTPHTAYKMIAIVKTHHDQYGDGQQVTIEGPKGVKYRVQLPGKYLATLSESDIDTFKTDIQKKDFPYLVYRETMPDKSYRLDVIEKSEENDSLFEKGEPVPELENSLEIEPQAEPTS